MLDSEAFEKRVIFSNFRVNARFFAFLATFFATRVARIVASFRIFREQK
nr:MAG TPA: hypothetical protein [Caudoviricetes sp.]